jgi:predicted nucleic acid-binding protein
MKLAYVDSSVWIARFEGLAKYRHKIDEELTRLAGDGFSFAASDAVLLEVLLKPAQTNDTATMEMYRQVFQQLHLAPVYLDVFIDALDIAKTEALKSMDAVHVALALNHECECFVSTDSHFKNLKLLSPVWIDLKLA